MAKSRSAAQRLAAPGTPVDMEGVGELGEICEAHAKGMVQAFFEMLERAGSSSKAATAIDRAELQTWFVDQLAVFAIRDATSSRVVQRLIRRANVAPSAARNSQNSNKAKLLKWARAELMLHPQISKQELARRYVRLYGGISFETARRYLADL